MSHLGSPRPRMCSHRSLLTVLALSLGGLVLAGCAPVDQTTTTTASDASATPAASAPVDSKADSKTDGGVDDTTPGDGATAARPPECRTSDLEVTLAGEEGAAGSAYLTVRLTNSSSALCRTGGHGGVSLVSTAQGEPVGAPADRVEQGQRRLLLLAPGASADAIVRVTSAESYSRAECRPVATAGLRVYPPNQTESVLLDRPTTGCRSAGVHLLQLSPYASAS